VTPLKSYAEQRDEQQRTKEAARDYAERKDELLGETARKHGLSVSVRERPVYGPGSEYSYFRDLITAGLADQRRQAAVMRHGQDFGDPQDGSITLNPQFGGPEESRKRLAAVEKRDVTSADPGARMIVVPAAPQDIELEVANSATATGTLAAALRTVALPATGKTLELPRVETGPSTAIQATEGTGVSETDLDTANVSIPIGTISGQADVTRQVAERSGWSFDLMISTELGKKLGAALDSQIVTGTGSSGQLLGLDNIGSIVTVTYTQASRTTQTTVSKLWEGYNQLSNPSTGFGVADPNAYLTIVHPRRYASLFAGAGLATTIPVAPSVPGTLVPSGGVPTNIGGTQDEALIVVKSEAVLFSSPSELRVHQGMDISDALKVRVSIVQYAALAAARQPKAIAQIRGTGCAPPVL
jgi:HK97 family phage major capsid protein